MKKIVCLVAILAFAVPALADIQFYGSDMGGGQIKIGYRAVDPNKVGPAAIALVIDFDKDNDVAQLKGDTVAQAIISKEATHFRFYIDYASALADPNTILNDYDPNDGSYASAHPLAKKTEKGVPDLTGGVDEVAYCVAKLSNPPEKGPNTTDVDLITLQLEANGAASTIVRIDEDDLRGGVVGSKLVTNLPLDVTVTFACPCLGEMTGDNKVTFDDVIKLAGDLNTYGVIISKKKTILPTDTLHWNDCGDATNDDKITFDDVIKVAGWINTYGVVISKKKTITCPHSYP